MKKGKKSPRRVSSKRTSSKRTSARKTSSCSSRESPRILEQQTPIPLTFSESSVPTPKTFIKLSDHKGNNSKYRPFKGSDDSSSSDDDVIPLNPSVLCHQCGIKMGTEQGLAELELKKLEPKSGFGIPSSDSSGTSSSSSDDAKTTKKSRKTVSCPPLSTTKRLCKACDEGWYSDTTSHHRHSDDNFPGIIVCGSNGSNSSLHHQDFASTSRGFPSSSSSSRPPPVPRRRVFGPRRSLSVGSRKCSLPRCQSCKFRAFDEDEDDAFSDDDDLYEFI